jgi:L-gulono-1,4-lactone dehydrogenase
LVTTLNVVLSVPSYLKVGLTTTLNIVLYGLTLERYFWLEGRVRKGVFMNWARRFRYRPKRFVRPSTEEEIVELVSNSRSLRVFGSGHSFNSGDVSDDTLVSLDNYSGLVWKDLDKKQIAVKGGTRVRDVVKLLLDEGFAFVALPSHDAQSIAGILSTDVHGTGKIYGTEGENWGFVSQSVVRLKLVDGKGDIHECEPSDDLFKAAVGGIGAVGIITEVVIQGVDRFNVDQRVQMSDMSFVEQNFDRLLRTNDHFSLYLFPFTNRCQINTWNRTERKRTLLGDFWEFVIYSRDSLLAAWVGNLIAYLGLLSSPSLSSIAYGIQRGTDLILESNKAFHRPIYYLHQELEFTIPLEDTFEVCRRFIRLYEDLYPSGLPYVLFEVRFTPDKHERTLIGPGRDRRSTWIDLVCNDSRGFEKYYAAAQELIKEIGARPHLGKFCESFSKADMAKLHQDNFTKFLNLAEEHDPERKFANGFTRRLFGHEV